MNNQENKKEEVIWDKIWKAKTTQKLLSFYGSLYKIEF